MTETITGMLTCHRLAQRRRTRNLLAGLVADLVQPLPPHELWVISVLDPASPFNNDNGEPYRIYRTRSGKLPKVLDRALEGQAVTVRATVERWSNGLGGYISRVAA